MRPEHGSRQARVVSVGRNAVWIAFEDEELIRVAALRKNAGSLALVPGDLVRATLLEDERAVVDGLEPRSFALQRTTGGGRVKTMAANVDGIAIVAAFARPPLHVAMLDELIAFAELHEIGARLIFTKPDLVEHPDDLDAVPALYRKLGYPVSIVAPKHGDGVDSVARDLAAHRTLLIGQSGVGKSSLFAALGGTATVGEVSKIGRGKQTTTAGRLHRFPDGFLIDSPGVGEFELTGVAAAHLTQGFREFVEPARECRFRDCLHATEPGCGVRAALAAGTIAASRYQSYRAMLERADAR